MIETYQLLNDYRILFKGYAMQIFVDASFSRCSNYYDDYVRDCLAVMINKL